jgi:hypothetical protein
VEEQFRTLKMFESPSEETTRELAEKLRPEWHNLMLEAKEVRAPYTTISYMA